MKGVGIAVAVLVITIPTTVYPFLLHSYPEVGKVPIDGDPGLKLILTPLIESGQLEEARNASRVGTLQDGVDVESYSGFFTVDETYNSTMFFWYFPPENQNSSAPVLLWLQGGPGSSSLLGLFTEIGPYEHSAETDEMKKRQYSWASTNHLLFIDNPVGTGYSFTDSLQGYATNETTVGKNLHTALVQFFSLFPDLQQNEFYVAGESYAGKYVPAVAYAIHTENPNAELKINLQGIAIGNGICDPGNMALYGDLFYQLGLIDFNELKVFHQTEQTVRDNAEKGYWLVAASAFSRLTQKFYSYSGFSYNMNLLIDHGTFGEDYDIYVQKEKVRRALHVGDAEFHNSSLVLRYLVEDIGKSVAPWVAELLRHYRVLIYSGQLDLNVPYAATLGFLQALEWDGAEEYKTASRSQWKVGNELAGYVRTVGNLTELLVRNSGHMVPSDQPEWAFDLITRFTTGVSFNSE